MSEKSIKKISTTNLFYIIIEGYEKEGVNFEEKLQSILKTHQINFSELVEIANFPDGMLLQEIYDSYMSADNKRSALIILVEFGADPYLKDNSDNSLVDKVFQDYLGLFTFETNKNWSTERWELYFENIHKNVQREIENKKRRIYHDKLMDANYFACTIEKIITKVEDDPIITDKKELRKIRKYLNIIKENLIKEFY